MRNKPMSSYMRSNNERTTTDAYNKENQLKIIDEKRAFSKDKSSEPSIIHKSLNKKEDALKNSSANGPQLNNL